MPKGVSVLVQIAVEVVLELAPLGPVQRGQARLLESDCCCCPPESE